MPNRESTYKDKAKARKTWMEQKKRNYAIGRQYDINKGTRFTDEELEIIMAHTKTDREIAKELGRSVQSIQVKRSKLKGGY